MIMTVIVARETPITLKEFRAQLLSAERTAEDLPSSVSFPMSGMYCEGESSTAGVIRGGEHRQMHLGESSTQNGPHYNERTGFVGQVQRSSGNYNGNNGSMGHNQRPFGNNGGSNGGQQYNFNRNRTNFRPRFNGGYSGNRNNGGFSGSSGGY